MASDSMCSLAVDSIDTSALTMPESTSDSTLESPYRPLGPTQIRIVEILPGDFEQPIEIVLKTVDLEDKPTYDALSYVWNPTDGTIDVSKALQPAVIKGTEDFVIQITRNLDVAIRYLRQDKFSTSTLWIDALCINQDLALERNHQVGLMSRIYSSANDVLIWLGPPCQDSEFAFKTLSSGRLVEHDIDRFINALELLIRRDWFGRLWIAQELTLSQQEPLVFHGSQIMDWKALVLSIEVIKDRIEGKENLLQSQYLPILTNVNIEAISPWMSSYPPAVVARAETVLQLGNMRDAGSKASFADRILHTAYLQATDPRDRVYGLLGFSNLYIRSITPDYTKSITQLHAEAAMVVILESFTDYLYFQDRFDTKASKDANVSWFPDLEMLVLTKRSGPSFSPPLSVFQTALDTTGIPCPRIAFSNDCQCLYTWGQVLGNIKFFGTNRLMEPHSIELGLWKFIAELGDEIGAKNIVSALLGYSMLPEFDRLELTNCLALFVAQNKQHIGDLLQADEKLVKLVASYSRELTIFLTDTGFVGVMPRRCSEGFESCIVAGLFGINMPFILEQTSNGNYRMISMVFLADHALGDIDFIELYNRDEWSNGPLEGFTIV